MKLRVLSFITLIFLATIVAFTGLSSPAKTETRQAEDQHIGWIENSLTKIQTIQVGMTREQLLESFRTEGGLSWPLRRTYVFRECPYIKVDVEFTAVGRPERDAEGRVTDEESNQDVIKEISKPYLQWTITD
jgi:hypothetical protein